MFVKLKSGKVINALGVSLIEQFSAADEAPKAFEGPEHSPEEGYVQASISHRENFLREHSGFNARLYFNNIVVNDETILKSEKGMMFIEETPDEFMQSVNRQLRANGFMPG